MRIARALMKYKPKFSGCDFNSIPKNKKELDEIHETFNRVKELRSFDKFERGNGYQEQCVNYYKNLDKATQYR